MKENLQCALIGSKLRNKAVLQGKAASKMQDYSGILARNSLVNIKKIIRQNSTKVWLDSIKTAYGL